MSSKPKLGVDWRQFILETSGVVARMLFLKQDDALRYRRLYVREPRRAEIEQWLRNRK